MLTMKEWLERECKEAATRRDTLMEQALKCRSTDLSQEAVEQGIRAVAFSDAYLYAVMLESPKVLTKRVEQGDK